MPASVTVSDMISTQVTLRSDDLPTLVGGSPLIQLRRSGDSHVWLKHEGLEPGGSYFDRVALNQLRALPNDAAGIIIDGTTSFTASALALANSMGLRGVVLIDKEGPQRLVGLIRKLAFEAKIYRSPEQRDELLAKWKSAGFVELHRNDVAAHVAALTDLAIEVQEASELSIGNWVLPDYGVPVEEVERILRRVAGHPVQIVLLEDDFDRERTLDGSAASRRSQVGHREGMLIGPLGAEIIDRAVDVALTTGERVCAVVPDGGHRYLGWW